MKVQMFARVVQLPSSYTKAGEARKQRVGITTPNTSSNTRTPTGYVNQNKSSGVCKGCGG